MNLRTLAEFVIVGFCIKSIIFSVFIEVPCCKLGSSWTKDPAKENWLLAFSRDTLRDTHADPLFLALPDWLRLATCIHCYFFAPLYGILAVAIVLRAESLCRLVVAWLGPMLMNAIVFVAIVERFGELQPERFDIWLMMNADYAAVVLVMWWRFSPFGGRSGSPSSKKTN